MRLANKVDTNQVEIVAALRGAYCSVQHLHMVGDGCPDILVGRMGKNYLIEIKSEHGRLNDAQMGWHAEWRGEVFCVYTVEEALRVVGVINDQEQTIKTDQRKTQGLRRV